jgi:hypothetical protein
VEDFMQQGTIDSSWKKKTVLFLASQSASMFGSNLVQYAIVWYVTLTTQSGLMLTISTLAGFLPQILISLSPGCGPTATTVNSSSSPPTRSPR